MKRLILTVTNDLTYDQRMQRICSTLGGAGYDVTLVGRRLPGSLPLRDRNFRQKRLRCLVNKGPLFYAEYNLRLFFYLLFQRFDGVCAADLDTSVPAFLAAYLNGAARIYDAHELFTEMKEVRTRPAVQRVWTWVERFTVHRMHAGYTVSTGLAEVFLQRYGRPFDVIRNMPVARTTQPVQREERLLLYQGAVNEARGFEYIIPALRGLPFRLLVCGDGNFMEQLRALISEHGVSQQVELLGMVAPDELPAITARAWLGLNFLEPEGTSQYLSLTNKFFDYVQEGLPQLASDYPEYRRYNAEYEVALLIPLTTEAIAGALQRLEADSDLYRRLQANTLVARPNWTWEGEAVRLLEIIQTTLAQHGR